MKRKSRLSPALKQKIRERHEKELAFARLREVAKKMLRQEKETGTPWYLSPKDEIERGYYQAVAMEYFLRTLNIKARFGIGLMNDGEFGLIIDLGGDNVATIPTMTFDMSRDPLLFNKIQQNFNAYRNALPPGGAAAISNKFFSYSDNKQHFMDVLKEIGLLPSIPKDMN